MEEAERVVVRSMERNAEYGRWGVSVVRQNVRTTHSAHPSNNSSSAWLLPACARTHGRLRAAPMTG